jgi:copper resistance protein B
MNRRIALIVATLMGSAPLLVAAQDHSHHPASNAPETRATQHSDEKSGEPTESERRHVPPDPPQHAMGDMSSEEMTELMAMDDNASFGMVMLDQFEWRQIDGEHALGIEGDAWYGNDYHKAWFKAEGEIVAGDYEGRTELLWDRVATRWFNLQTGIRQDLGEGPSRSWLAVGAQGLAPYWFEVEATAYVGDEGRTALRFSGEYELLLTQRWILQPEIDVDIFGKDDPRNGIGSGLSEAEVSLRLRYEIRREFAPYIGLVWSQRFGDTADIARAEGMRRDDLELAVGVRIWF